MNDNFLNNLKYVQSNISLVLENFYGSHEQSKDNNVLLEAIKYSLFNEGKKLRPYLTWGVGVDLQVKEDVCFYVGAILEMMHTYSLIHDDLPSMDNDDIRHNKPSLHVKYGEAIAVLTGDSLLTDAFKFLSDKSLNIKDSIKINIVNLTSLYLGSKGMILGQAKDLTYENKSNSKITIDNIENIHYLKTAKFMELAVLLGAILAGVDTNLQSKLKIFGKNIGLAFQIIDDISDIDDNDINNICNILSKEEARYKAINLLNEATSILNGIDIKFEHLHNIVHKLHNDLKEGM